MYITILNNMLLELLVDSSPGAELLKDSSHYMTNISFDIVFYKIVQLAEISSLIVLVSK